MSQTRIIKRLKEKAKNNGTKTPVFTFEVTNDYAIAPTKITFATDTQATEAGKKVMDKYTKAINNLGDR